MGRLVACRFHCALLKAGQSVFASSSIGLDIAMGGRHALMPQPECDDAEGDAGLQHIHGGGSGEPREDGSPENRKNMLR